MPFDGGPNIGVIGAGFSGLRAVNTFQNLALEYDLPLPETTIIDAASGPGGRAKSFMLDGVVIDKGMHWLHRGLDNRLYQVAIDEFGISPDDFVLDTLSSVSYIESRGQLVDSFRAAALDILDVAYTRFKLENPGKDISLHDLAIYTKDPRVILECELSLGCTWAGVMPIDVSYHEIDRDPAMSGGFQYKYGMGQLVQRMADKVANNGAIFEYNCRINSISQDNAGCHFAVDDRRRFDVSVGGITLPVGVVKRALEENTIQIEPRPRKKVIRAFDGMQMGHMNKIATVMDEDYLIAKSAIEPRVQQDGRLYFRLDNMAREIGGLKGFIHVRSGGSPVVMIYFGGPGSLWVARNADKKEEVADKIFKYSGIYADYKPHLRAAALCDSNLDEDVGGAYSAAFPHHKRFKPIRDRNIVWLGEAFAKAKKSPGTADACIWSGDRGGEILFRRWQRLLPERSSKTFVRMAQFAAERMQLAA